MDKEGVALREVDAQRAVGCLSIADAVGIKTVIARKHVLVHHVCVDDVAKSLRNVTHRSVVERIACDGAALIGYHRAVQQMCPLAMSVVGAVGTPDVCLVGVNVRWANDACKACASVVVQSVADEGEIGIFQFHIVVKNSLTRRGLVLSPVAGQRVLLINQPATIEEVTQIIQPVIIKRITVEAALSVGENNIVTCTRHLVAAVVE